MSNINWVTVGMLMVSNLVMLYAWYGHLRNMANAPLWMVVVVSWLIALAEYCVAVPANRIGAKTMTLEQLKIVQEAVKMETAGNYRAIVDMRARLKKTLATFRETLKHITDILPQDEIDQANAAAKARKAKEELAKNPKQ